MILTATRKEYKHPRVHHSGTGLHRGANPMLELVGCYAWSADKVGRDAGELRGIDRLGVAATNDVDTTFYDSPATEMPVGFGRPIDHPDLMVGRIITAMPRSTPSRRRDTERSHRPQRRCPS